MNNFDLDIDIIVTQCNEEIKAIFNMIFHKGISSFFVLSLLLLFVILSADIFKKI